MARRWLHWGYREMCAVWITVTGIIPISFAWCIICYVFAKCLQFPNAWVSNFERSRPNMRVSQSNNILTARMLHRSGSTLGSLYYMPDPSSLLQCRLTKIKSTRYIVKKLESET